MRSAHKPVVVGLMALGLVVSGQLTAIASPSAASVTVSPSTGLSDGDTVSATVAGFAASETVVTVECAQPQAGTTVCDLPGLQQAVTDSNGSASTQLTARRTFTGYTADGLEWGLVDCTSVPGGCGVYAANVALTTGAQASISFR
ncbi:enediyne antibiotic chromoprotein [Kibdelosporangium persicum]|uniref:Neocarzinostatin family protein n=1 Tax=Kibdelosporangium persicum TaxID=2698649 RepID=A0ABX2FJU6_9PSEU|nr:enediyne antibiotic chromoprotein [Kibdelosporangium persicum]NRN71399.1 Neocarzinostatin family protein [Kibdelosporangium persicum]